MLSLRRHMRIKSLWRGAGTNTFSVKLPEELLHCNWFSFSLSFCQVHNWIWVSQMKVWCNTVFVLFWSQEASLGLFICLMVYFSWIRVHPIFIWHIFSEFTILTVFQAGAGGGGGGEETAGRRHCLTTRGQWVVRPFQLWFEESWVLWSPSGECSECLKNYGKVTYFVMNTSCNATSDTY